MFKHTYTVFLCSLALGRSVLFFVQAFFAFSISTEDKTCSSSSFPLASVDTLCSLASNLFRYPAPAKRAWYAVEESTLYLSNAA